jgi:hypothetical protein
MYGRFYANWAFPFLPLADALYTSVVVAMIGMRVMDVTLDEIVDVSRVRYRFMPAS